MNETNNQPGPCGTELPEQQRKLNDDIAVVHGWLTGLGDREYPKAGEDFARAIFMTGTTEVSTGQTHYNAVFNSFIYPPLSGQNNFTNTVTYGAEAINNREKMFAARCHEMIHALQYQKAAALHADPFNTASDIVLSPEDYILRKERLEQDAYVKGAWLTALADAAGYNTAKEISGCPLSVETYLAVTANETSLTAAFNKAADATRNAEKDWYAGNTAPVPIKDVWAKMALDEYDRVISKRIKKGDKITFVRMEDADVREIGESFGPNTFATYDAPATLKDLSPDNRKRLDDINAKLGIADRNALMTFNAALAEKNMKRGGFLKISRAYKNT